MIDVILSCRNTEKYIQECIESILSQEYSQFRLFVFDDYSTDSTVEKIKTFNDQRLTLVESKKNIGTYAAKNFIFNNFITSEYVALHDADDISLSSRFNIQLKELATTDPSVACIGTSVLEFWEMENFMPHTSSSFPVTEKSRINLYPEKITIDSLVNDHSCDYISILKSKMCMNGTVIFRTSAIRDIGGWDGRTRFSGDSDIFLRLLGSGKTIKNIQNVLYKRRFHESSLTASSDTGINSAARTKYNDSILSDVKKCIDGICVKRDFFYPTFEYMVTKCVE